MYFSNLLNMHKLFVLVLVKTRADFVNIFFIGLVY